MCLDKFYFGSYQFSVSDQAKTKYEYHKHKNYSALSRLFCNLTISNRYFVIQVTDVAAL